jgi:hypothetical protein
MKSGSEKKVLPLLDAAGTPLTPPESPLPELEVHHDRPGPTGPPGQLVRHDIPPSMAPILGCMQSAVDDEALLLEFCTMKATEVLERTWRRGAVGTDLFGDGQGGNVPNRTTFVVTSVPLAVELYRQALAALNGPRKKEFLAAVEERNRLEAEENAAKKVVSPNA